jgi:4'-phosphopantetheinyl transferase
MASGSAPVVFAWWVALDLDAGRRTAVTSVLSDEERARAARFRRERDAHRWSVSRGALRRILARALDRAPAEIRFGEGEHGKPRVLGRNERRVDFNLSHAAGMALIALTEGHPLGADVEQVAPMDDMPLVAERQFSREERQALFALPEAERLGAFYRIWTRKEAYIKAIGHGLSHPLDRFAVTLGKGDARLLHLDGDERAAEAWSLHDLEPTPDGRYAAALAMPFRGAEVRVRHWEPGTG